MYFEREAMDGINGLSVVGCICFSIRCILVIFNAEIKVRGQS